MLLAERRPDRQREVGARGLLGRGKLDALREPAHRFLPVDRRPVVGTALDTCLVQSLDERVGPLAANDVEVPGGVGIGDRVRLIDEPADAGLAIQLSSAPAPVAPLVQVRKQRTSSAIPSSSVATAPASPKAPRFFEG